MGDPTASWSQNTLSIFWWQLLPTALAAGAALCLVLTRQCGDKTAIGITATAGVVAVAAYTLAMILRGGQGSFYDTMLLMWPVAVLIVATLPRSGWANGFARGLVIVGFALPSAWIVSHWRDFLANDGIIPGDRQSELMAGGRRWNEDLYLWNRSHGLPVFVLAKHANFITGSLEDMVMRGMGDGLVGNYHQAATDPTKLRFFPHLHFIELKDRPAFPKDHVFMWSERIKERLPGYYRERTKLDAESTARTETEAQRFDDRLSRYLEEGGYAALLRKGACRSWANVHWRMRIHSCAVRRP